VAVPSTWTFRTTERLEQRGFGGGETQVAQRPAWRRREVNLPEGLYCQGGTVAERYQVGMVLPLSGSDRVLVAPAVRRCGQRSWAAASSGAKLSLSVRAVHAALSASGGAVPACQLVSMEPVSKIRPPIFPY
jgi:hypothetical protein